MPYHPSIFEQINAKTLRKSTLRTHGSHGPSGLDACEWRRIITHFKQTSIELCKTIAKLSYTIATKVLPKENLTACNSCRLIPLDKNPGLRPIGIGEVLRTIIGKTITHCIKSDLKSLRKISNSACARSVESNMLSTAGETSLRKRKRTPHYLLLQKMPSTCSIENLL